MVEGRHHPGPEGPLRRAPPRSEAELLARCGELAGKSLQQVANELKVPVPPSQTRAKGWAGQLIELWLGATAASRPEPDFQQLGIELKTLPVNRHGRAAEATFVCAAPMKAPAGLRWASSAVRSKLAQVLWTPIEADPSIRLGNRRVGQSFLWSPGPEQARALEQDWQELIELLCLGEYDKISAEQGECLQLRPKAARSSSRVAVTLANGAAGAALPLAFYLRPRFVNSLLDERPGS